MKTVAKILATFFGIGLFPVAPGTLASAVAVLAFRIALHGLAWPLYLLLLGAGFGTEVEIVAEGKEEMSALTKVAELFEGTLIAA